MYLVKRNKTYHLFYEDNSGKLKSITTKCTTKTAAETFVQKFIADLKNSSKLERITYNFFKDFYKDYSFKRFSKSYQEFIYYAFEQFGRVISGSCFIDEIKPADIYKFVQLKLSEAGERIINGYLRTLQGAFQRAVELGYLKENVFKSVKKIKPKINLPVFPSVIELTKIIKSENDYQLKALYLFAYYTGMRMGEIRYIRWSSIDFVNNCILIENHQEFTTKSKRARLIPLHSMLKEELIKIRPVICLLESYVFNKNGAVLTKDFISHRLKSAVRKAGVNEALHFHSLRHGHASQLILESVPISYVKELLGHQSIQTTQIYTYLQMQSLNDAVNKLPKIEKDKTL